MIDLLIKGGILVDADERFRVDVAVTGGRVMDLVPPGETVTAQETIDATGTLLFPGLVDAHAHLREPGLTHKEDFDTGTHAAALGGVTTVLDMPTDEPWTASAEQLTEKMVMARNRIHVDVGFQVAVTHEFGELSRLRKLAPVSFELFTADVPAEYQFATADAVIEALRQLSATDTLIGISPGDQSILFGNLDRNKAGSIAAFLASRPPAAEAGGIARAILSAAVSDARVHIRQVNSALGIKVWSRLKDMADASIETTVQNMFFTAADYKRGGAGLKASPPFRMQEDVEVLRDALRSGIIDVVATDHAPHSPADKAAAVAAFADIPGGMPGLQTLLLTMLKLVEDGAISHCDIARVCARNPAERFGLGRQKGRIAPGYDADILVVDPRRTSLIVNADQVSRARYTPFDGMSIRSSLARVFLRGREIVRDGMLIVKAHGKTVTRQSQ
jgi:dihydroorotase